MKKDTFLKQWGREMISEFALIIPVNTTTDLKQVLPEVFHCQWVNDSIMVSNSHLELLNLFQGFSLTSRQWQDLYPELPPEIAADVEKKAGHFKPGGVNEPEPGSSHCGCADGPGQTCCSEEPKELVPEVVCPEEPERPFPEMVCPEEPERPFPEMVCPEEPERPFPEWEECCEEDLEEPFPECEEKPILPITPVPEPEIPIKKIKVGGFKELVGKVHEIPELKPAKPPEVIQPEGRCCLPGCNDKFSSLTCQSGAEGCCGQGGHEKTIQCARPTPCTEKMFEVLIAEINLEYTRYYGDM